MTARSSFTKVIKASVITARCVRCVDVECSRHEIVYFSSLFFHFFSLVIIYFYAYRIFLIFKELTLKLEEQCLNTLYCEHDLFEFIKSHEIGKKVSVSSSRTFLFDNVKERSLKTGKS